MSKIAEGFSRGGNVEFLQFLFIAKGSLSELQSQPYVALDLAYISQDEFQQAYSKVDRVAKTMNTFVQAVKRTGKTGLFLLPLPRAYFIRTEIARVPAYWLFRRR